MSVILGVGSGTAFRQDIFANRPAPTAAIEGYFFYATDTQQLFQCNGSIWVLITEPYVLPIASSSVLGGVKQGTNITIDGSGIISGAAPYTLPIASASTLGGVKQGANTTIDGAGVISVAAPYSLPIASASTLGGIKVGSGLSIDGTGILSTVNNGTVTSVAMTVPSTFSISGSAITSSGTLGLTWNNQSGNVVLASPSGGGSGTPGFRSLVTGDIPNLDTSKLTSGLLATLRGGTGVDSSAASNGTLLIGNGSGFSLTTLTQGTNIGITNASGTITINSTYTYTLPNASASVLGGIKVGTGLSIDGGGVLSSSELTDAITFVINGGGAAIATGIVGDLVVPYACTINQVTMLADQTSNSVVDIWKQVYASFPPTVTNKITASAPPTLASNVKAQDSTLTGWTTAISAGDVLRFNVNSNSSAQLITLSLRVVRS